MLRLKNFRLKSFRSSPNNDEEGDQSLSKREIQIFNDRDVRLDYNLGDHLGSGKFGEVNKCREINSGQEFACKKIVLKAEHDRVDVMNEVKIMKILRHPKLIQLYDVYCMSNSIILILELITGGELFERIIDDNFDLNESKCAFFMREILIGMEYIHSQKIVHLDMKPENILCLSKDGYRIKIIDFGLAKQLEKKELRVLFGTPEFVAPEIIAYDPISTASDMWSIGVISYVLLSGLSPFMDDTEADTLNNIIRVNYSFEYSEFKEISQEAKDFIRKLLIKDPRKRMSATECLNNPWIKNKIKTKRSATVNKKRLKNYVYRRKWQKAVNAIIALRRMGVNLTSNNSTVQNPDALETLSQETQENEKELNRSLNGSQLSVIPKISSRRSSMISNSPKIRKGSLIGSFLQINNNKPQSPLSLSSDGPDGHKARSASINTKSPISRQQSAQSPISACAKSVYLSNSSSKEAMYPPNFKSPPLSKSPSINSKNKLKTKSPNFIQKLINQKSSS